MPVSISVVVATKNEERNIERCLNSIRDLADEIIVLDSYSTDATEAICKRYANLSFYQRDWEGYSGTKNYANGLASGDFILSLDADEEVSAELLATLKHLKVKLNKSTKIVYELDRLTNYCGQWIWHSGWRPDFQMRLFPRGEARWDGSEVHEALSLNEGVVREKIHNGLLNHYSFFSISDHVAKINLYTTLGAQKVVRVGGGWLRFKSVTRAPFRFLRTYFLNLGFLDGYYGFVISVLGAYAVYLKYAKAVQLLRTQELDQKRTQE
jgi:glycosyltransferase involved in cell wall biosynthesis